MVPVIGGAATAARAGKTIYKAVDSAGDVAKTTDNATDAAKAADNAGDTAKASDSGTSTPAKSNDSPDTCPNSFVPGTHVVMADGTTRAIERTVAWLAATRLQAARVDFGRLSAAVI